MLDLKEKHLYTELLFPPDGYELDKALGATYSMDLYILLALPVSLYFSRDVDDGSQNDRTDVLAAIRETASKLRVFCNRGRIHFPERYSQLFCFLEPCIRQVYIRGGSFHPKFWLLRYLNRLDGQVIYRIIVTSRNLTDSHDLDLCFFTDGKVDLRASRNSGLKSAVKYLRDVDGDRGTFYREILEDIPHIVFELPQGFQDAKFHDVEGLIFPAVKADSLLVISPFLKDRRLSELATMSERKPMLFSLRESLDSINEKTIQKYDAYVLQDRFIDGESMLDERQGPTLRRKLNLHAKLYAFGMPDGDSRIYLGSANCTNAAFAGNKELMVELDSTSQRYLPKRLHDALLQSGVFEEYIRGENVTAEVDPDQDLIQKITREIEGLRLTGTIWRTDQDGYVIQLKAEGKLTQQKGWRIKAALLTNKGKELPLSSDPMTFGPLSLQDVTAFVAVFVYKGSEKKDSLVIKADLTMPEERDRAVFNALIDSADKLLQYLHIYLDGRNAPEKPYLKEHSWDGGGDGRSGSSKKDMPTVPLYENLLIIASREPDRLKRIGKVIEEVASNQTIDTILLEELKLFWEPFKKIAE